MITLAGNELRIHHLFVRHRLYFFIQGRTFRSKITSYGNFRNGAVWASDQCQGSCPVVYGGQYKTTVGLHSTVAAVIYRAVATLGFGATMVLVMAQC